MSHILTVGMHPLIVVEIARVSITLAVVFNALQLHFGASGYVVRKPQNTG